MSSRGQSGQRTNSVHTLSERSKSYQSVALARALEQNERLIANGRTEHAYAFAADGRRVASTAGSRTHVRFSDEELARLPGTVLTHNHPSGNSISRDDLRFAARHQLAELRAVTSTMRYSVRPPANLRGGWTEQYWHDVLQPAYRRASNATTRSFWKAINSGQMTPQEADARQFDTIMEKVASATGIRYTKSPW